MKSRKSIALGNMLWRFAERCGAQGVSFLVSIVLARLLSPDEYGTIALVTVFTTILNVFVDSGLSNAVIQKKDADDIDFSTVFYFNIVVCCTLYIIMFVSAPAIANFYQRPELTSVVRVLSLTLIISGVKNMQQAYVSRNLLFKRFFFATLGGTVGAAVLGIIMAYLGFGVWALVVQQIFNAAVDTIILWITVKWRPKKCFSFLRLKGLLNFGWKLLVSSLLDTIYNNIRQLLIGRMYSPSELAHYNRGKQFPNLIITNVNLSIDSVLLPMMAKEQDSIQRVKSMTRRSIKTSSYIMAPMMMGMAFVAEPLIRLVLTEKWLPCVLYLRIFCFTYMFHPIHTANLKAIVALGRSDLNLKLEIVKKVVGFIVLFSTAWISVEAMAYSLLLTSVTSQIINSYPNKKLLGYGYNEQLKDIMPSVILSIIMGCCIYPIQLLGFPDIITLFIQIPLGVIIYVFGSYILKIDSLEYLWDIVKPLIWRKKG